MDVPVRCHDRRLDAKTTQTECWVVERRGANTSRLEAERAAQCSGSLSEEQFILAKYFGGARPIRGGTFLELGAFDGWKESNTLHLESCLGWRGILMDGQPAHLDWMRSNRPQSVSLGVAICPQHGLVNYSRVSAGTTSGIVGYMARSVRQRFRVDASGQAPVPCGPLGSWLSLLGVTHLDFVSLDVQGAEHMVLSTLDWSALSVGVLLTECKRLGCTDPQDAAVRTLLEGRAGLRWAGMLRARHDVWDGVFINQTLWKRHHRPRTIETARGAGTR